MEPEPIVVSPKNALENSFSAPRSRWKVTSLFDVPQLKTYRAIHCLETNDAARAITNPSAKQAQSTLDFGGPIGSSSGTGRCLPVVLTTQKLLLVLLALSSLQSLRLIGRQSLLQSKHNRHWTLAAQAVHFQVMIVTCLMY